MPANPFEQDLRKLREPLRESTLKIRKALLVWSLAAVAITLGQLFPSEISALGMKVTPPSHSILLALMAAIVGYHVAAFVVYASSDFMHWYVAHKSTGWEEDTDHYESYKSELLARTRLSEEDREFMEEHERRLGAIWRAEASLLYTRVSSAIPYVSAVRATFDFALPIVVGMYAIVLLVSGSRTAL